MATISRVAGFLEREALLTRDVRGRVIDVRWEQLIERWATEYSLTASNRTAPYLEPRGFSELLGKLRGVAWRYALTGSLGAARVAPIASPRLAVIYVDDPVAVAEALSLRPAEKGANVLVVEPFDAVVFDRTLVVDGVRYAALSQVAADLLTSPGRGPEEGAELLRWMRGHEDAWREAD